jgi:hypothetical protein
MRPDKQWMRRRISAPLYCDGVPSLLQGLLWETSLLDAEEGIRFRGYSIPELQVLLQSLSYLQLCM